MNKHGDHETEPIDKGSGALNPYADYQMALDNQKKLEAWATRGAPSASPLLARLAALATRLRRSL